MHNENAMLKKLVSFRPHEEEYVHGRHNMIPQDQLIDDIRQFRAIQKADAAEGGGAMEEPTPEPAFQGPPVRRTMGRHYTTAELDAMEQQNAAPPPQGVVDPAVAIGKALSPNTLSQMGQGAIASLKRTYLGLKQLSTYLTGDDAAREKVNEEIRAMEEEYGPVLSEPAGKAGEVAGVVAQMAGPGTVLSTAGKAIPRFVQGARSVIGAPGTVPRATAQGAGFEATQPIDPGDTSTEQFIQGKAGRTAIGAGGAAVAGKVAKSITSPGPTIAPERGKVVKEAERLGINLTPAQRTGDVTLSQYEEGLASRPGSAKTILDVRQSQQDVLNKKATEALGLNAAAPNEMVLSTARENAQAGYQPLASIKKMSWDARYVEDLDKFINSQSRKATGSKDAAGVAQRLKKGAGKWSGDDFLEELQGVRDMAFEARKSGDVATAKQLNDLSEILENFAERRVEKLAAKGEVDPDAVKLMKQARTEYATLRAIEKATEPVTGKVSSLKYLSNEFKRKPASSGPGNSPVDEKLRDVGATARVLKQVTPYIGSSGTAERIAGQQLVEASQGPMAAWRAAGPLLKNYLAAKYYMQFGGKPGFFGSRLSPDQNMYVRRMLPPTVIGAGEGASE